jgi:hypothetical protein
VSSSSSTTQRTAKLLKKQRLGKDPNARLKKMAASEKLKMYGQLLLTAQRYNLRERYDEATELRREAEQILMHFQKNFDQ